MSDRADIDSPLRDTDPLLWNALRAAHLFKIIDISVLENEAGRAEALMAGKRLAKFIRREHPADDDEPFTMEWVGTVGGKSDGSGDWFFIRDEETFATVRFTHDYDWNIYAEIGTDDPLQVEMKTRSDLRRLCKGLKIELKEKA